MALKFRSFFSRTERSYTEKMEQGSAKNTKDEDDDFEDAASELTPLSAVADSFEELSALVKSKGFNHDLDLKTLCDACSHVSVLFGCLGIAFKFAELEYISKVSDLTEAAASYWTLNTILHIDVINDTVRASGSLSRNLRRVRQGLDLIRALFQNFLSSDYYCLKDAASEAYTTTCAMYHTWAVRTAVYAGMYALPTRDQLLINLNETDESAEREMQRLHRCLTADHRIHRQLVHFKKYQLGLVKFVSRFKGSAASFSKG